MSKKILARLAGAALVLVAGAALTTAVSAAGGGGGFGCPDVWNPVICSNGQVYSNQCYANLARAKNCVPYGND